MTKNAAVENRPRAVERTRKYRTVSGTACTPSPSAPGAEPAESQHSQRQGWRRDEPDQFGVLVVGDLMLMEEQAKLVEKEPDRVPRRVSPVFQALRHPEPRDLPGRQRAPGTSAGLGGEIVRLVSGTPNERRGFVGPIRVRSVADIKIRTGLPGRQDQLSRLGNQEIRRADGSNRQKGAGVDGGDKGAAKQRWRTRGERGVGSGRHHQRECRDQRRDLP